MLFFYDLHLYGFPLGLRKVSNLVSVNAIRSARDIMLPFLLIKLIKKPVKVLSTSYFVSRVVR